MDITPSHSLFKRYLREALAGLYDPAVLTASPLATWLGLPDEGNKVNTLRQALVSAIETFKPSQSDPKGAKSWRMYQILSQRYTAQWTQRKVADNIGLSERQLQREEKDAFEMLADFLWSQVRVEEQGEPPERNAEPSAQISEEGENLQTLTSEMPPQSIDIWALLRGVVRTLKTVADSAQVEIKVENGKGKPEVFTQAALLRQGLLNLLNQSIQVARGGGQVIVKIESQPGAEVVQILIWLVNKKEYINDTTLLGKFSSARRLLQACGAAVEIDRQESSSEDGSQAAICVSFPVTSQLPVLFIEDHADALRLYQYHISGTRYQFLGASTGRQGLSLAKEALPKVILIDVMMPDQDGWRLLEQLRMHPKTQHIPVIVCSVLPQSELAQALGAAGFLQKPIKQADLLAALDQLTQPGQTAPG